MNSDSVADVRVSGTLADLVEMLEGQSDGDALFFSRSLQVQGDTEALLTLRNALDSENVRVADLLIPPMLLPAAQKMETPTRHLYEAFAEDMAVMAQALNGALEKRFASLSNQHRLMQRQVMELEEKLAKQSRQLHQLQKKEKRDASA